MMGRKTLGEVRAELEAALANGAALQSGRGEVPESLRRFLGRESASAAKAGPDEGRGAAGTGQTTPKSAGSCATPSGSGRGGYGASPGCACGDPGL